MAFEENYVESDIKFSDIKGKARKILSQKATYFKVIIGFVLCMLCAATFVALDYLILNTIEITGIADFVSHPDKFFGILENFMICFIFTFIVLPVFFGFIKFVHEIIPGQNISVLTCFCYFESVKMYGRALAFSIWFSVKAGVFVLFCFGGYYLSNEIFTVLKDKYTLAMATMVLSVSVLLLVVIAVLIVIAAGRNFCTLAMFVRNDKIRISEIRRISHKATKGKLMKIWLYKLSYISDALVAIVTAMLSFGLYTFPVAAVSYFIFTDSVLIPEKRICEVTGCDVTEKEQIIEY